jgi:carbon monoxide dehydrogenase subunit G
LAAAGSASYRFVTIWTLQAPIEAVWAELSRPEAWPEWWRGVRRVELVEPGDAAGVGALRRVTMTSTLPYRLTFAVRTVRLDRPHVIEVQSDGDLRGSGRWSLTSAADTTIARYDWNVEVTQVWMRRLDAIARPLFAWNHDVLMRRGLAGLQRRLANGASGPR